MIASDVRGGGTSRGLQELNDLPREEAEERLRACCAASGWVRAMASRRPFADLEHLLATSDEVWETLRSDDIREAIDHHPRLGGGELEERRFRATAAHSRREQAGILSADARTRQALARAQEDYERRFGIIFLICASGRSAAEILAELERRMDNDPGSELEVAAEELGKITRLRLATVFGGSESAETRADQGERG